jgi:short-subunit dehydrogenase
MALLLAREGGRLAIAARRETLLIELADEIERSGSERPSVLVADLSKRGEPADLAAAAVEHLGGVDILINNAGHNLQGLQTVVADGDEGREALEVNFWSPLSLIGKLVPPMLERNHGSVVNVTSLMQVSPFPYLGHDASTKAALALATETLRLELQRTGIQVLEVVLGLIDTATAAENRQLPGGKRWQQRSRAGHPAEAARAILDALEDGRSRLVYPRRLGIVYQLPWMGRTFARRMAGRADPNDNWVRVGGSMGHEENLQARAAWEQTH